MTLDEIKTAVRAGHKVHWASEAYEVSLSHYRGTGGEQWLIKCVHNNSCIGLTHADGVTMNGQPEDFFIGQNVTEREPYPNGRW